MNLKYKILELRPDQHSIIVRYYTDIMTEEKLVSRRNLDGTIGACRTDVNIDLPVPAPTGEDLHVFIITRAPQDWLAMQEAIENPAVDTSLTALEALVGQEVVVPVSTQV